jgi:hypothetical protein
MAVTRLVKTAVTRLVKMAVTRLVEMFQAFYGTLAFNIFATNSPKKNLVTTQNFRHFIKVDFNITLPSTSWSPELPYHIRISLKSVDYTVRKPTAMAKLQVTLILSFRNATIKIQEKMRLRITVKRRMLGVDVKLHSLLTFHVTCGLWF